MRTKYLLKQGKLRPVGKENKTEGSETNLPPSTVSLRREFVLWLQFQQLWGASSFQRNSSPSWSSAQGSFLGCRSLAVCQLPRLLGISWCHGARSLPSPVVPALLQPPGSFSTSCCRCPLQPSRLPACCSSPWRTCSTSAKAENKDCLLKTFTPWL